MKTKKAADPKIRVSYNKRKRGLIRKAIEFSKLCSQDVFIAVLDRERQNYIEFNSSLGFNYKSIEMLHTDHYMPNLNYELYTNEDFEALENKFISQY